MKKIFTLLFAVGMFTLAQAQPGSRDNRDFDHRNDQQNDQRIEQQNDQQYDRQFDQRDFNDGYDNNGFDKGGRYYNKFSMERRKRMEIARINQHFDYKIQRVQRSFYMSWFEKQRMIRSLEQQRQWEIRKVYVRYTYSRKPDYGRGNRSNGHY